MTLGKNVISLRRFDPEGERYVAGLTTRASAKVTSIVNNGPSATYDTLFQKKPMALYIPVMLKNLSPEEVADKIIGSREVVDFAYYCIFGPNPKTSEAFANLNAYAAKFPVTEDIFKKYFGEDYTTFHKEVYDFYTKLGGDKNWGPDSVRIPSFTEKDPPPLVHFQYAQRSQNARIISEWFATPKDKATSRRTLRLALEKNPEVANDLEFVAEQGVIEARFGDKTKAIPLLEKAVSMNVARPGIYRLLSALRLASILEEKSYGYKLTAADIESIIKPLNVALKFSPPNASTYQQLAAPWKYTDVPPTAETLDALVAGCHTFPDNLDLLEVALPVLAKQGRNDVVQQILDEAADQVLTWDEWEQLDTLQKKLPAQ